MGANTVYLVRFEGVNGEEVKPIYDALRDTGCNVEVFHREGKQLAIVTSKNGFDGEELEVILARKDPSIPAHVDWDYEEFVKVDPPNSGK